MVMNGINPAGPGYSPKPQLPNPLLSSAVVPSAPSTASTFNLSGSPASDSLTLSSAAPNRTVAPAMSQSNFLPLQPLPTDPLGSPARPIGSAAGLTPGTPAQQTGKQVGDLVTKFLEETPALQEKIQHIDWDALSQEDLKPKVEKYRASVQQALKHVPKFVDHKLALLFEDPQSRKLANEFDTWLRKEPTPETLAELNKPKARPTAGAGVDEFEEEAPSRRHSSSLDDSEDTMPDEQPPRTLLGKARERAEDGISELKDGVTRLKDHFAPEKVEAKPHAKLGKIGRSGGDDMNDADLQELLGNLRSSRIDSPASPHHRPHGRDDSSF